MISVIKLRVDMFTFQTQNNKPGPLRSITNFFKRFGTRDRDRQRKSGGTQKSSASCDNADKSNASNLSRPSNLPRLNSSSHTQLPPIVQNPICTSDTLSISPKIQSNGKTSKDDVNFGTTKRCLKDILNRRIEDLEWAF